MAEYMTIEVLKQYSPVDERKIGRLLNEEINKSQIKFVVLDDDPTGIQTVHDISVFTPSSAGEIDSLQYDCHFPCIPSTRLVFAC